MDMIILFGLIGVDTFFYLVWSILPTDKALLFACGYNMLPRRFALLEIKYEK